MQVDVDKICMHTNFSWCGLSSFRVFKFGQIFLLGQNYKIKLNQLNKFMQVEVNEICMHTNFGGCRLSSFGFKLALKFGLTACALIINSTV